jgi:hypothetical protein
MALPAAAVREDPAVALILVVPVAAMRLVQVHRALSWKTEEMMAGLRQHFHTVVVVVVGPQQ